MLPAFEPERRSDAATGIDETDGGTDDDTDMQTILTANGVYAYDYDWNNTEKPERPTNASARFLHRARQRTDTSRCWSMRWPPDAVSLLGRAFDLDTGKKRMHSYDSCVSTLSRSCVNCGDSRRTDASAAMAPALGNNPGRMGRNEAQTGINRPQRQAGADARMGYCGEASAMQAQASPLSDSAVWWPTYDRRVCGKASTNSERSR